MNRDPQGYYERLGLDWEAPPDAIQAAYRRKARLLHPDVPGTGSATAFMAVKEAYDALADPLRRAAYDRAARAPDPSRSTVAVDAATEIHPNPPPPPVTKTRGPRLSDLPIAVWAGLGIVALVVGTEVVLHLKAPPSAGRWVEVPTTAPTVPPQVPPPAARPIRLIGNTNVYVTPADRPALVLRLDQPHNTFIPEGQLPAFSAVEAVRVLRDHGLVEIRLSETTTGFVDAIRLIPGNATAARLAYCTYNSGPSPANGEILARNGAGAGRTMIENLSGQAMVVKLRDHTGGAAATVFLAPGEDAFVDGLPDGVYRPDYAVGEVWSRACNRFVVGMRAQRFAAFADISTLSKLAIPPDLPDRAPPVDIPDQDFEQK